MYGFITIRFYITLKRTAHTIHALVKFYNYTILHYSQTDDPRHAVIERFYNYTILHYSQTPTAAPYGPGRSFITIRFYITLKPQTSNLRIDTLQYQESLYPYYTTRQQSESITTLFATFNLSFRSKQSR